MVRPLKAVCLSLCFLIGTVCAQDFAPIPPEELALKDNPKLPGSHAMVLLWERTDNDMLAVHQEHVRLKIFTEQGKRFGDIELPDSGSLRSVKARTIRPDGTSVEVKTNIFEKTVVRYRSFRYKVKTFSFPDVQPGAILEYRFEYATNPYFLSSTYWPFQIGLFVKKARFRMVPAAFLTNYWVGLGIPIDKDLQRQKDGSIQIELEDLKPFEAEDFAPPEDELKAHALFFYGANRLDPTEDKFWERTGKEYWQGVERYLDKPKLMSQVVAQIVAKDDGAEVKLRKIYTAAQRLRNTSFDRDKTEKEEKREKLKESKTVEDTWKHQYGDRVDINYLFAALARAAGVPAKVVLLGRRDGMFFKKMIQFAGQLDLPVVMAEAEGTTWYLDPGTPFCPFGLLTWWRTGVQGLALDKSTPVFVKSPNPNNSDSFTARRIKLRRTENGFHADLNITFEGQDALKRRLDVINEDDATIGKQYEDEVKASLPPGATVKVSAVENARETYKALTVTAEAELPDISSATGSRSLMPLAVWQSNLQNPFRHDSRKYPIYFAYPYQEFDSVTFELPAGATIETLPKDRTFKNFAGYYNTKWSSAGNSITLERRFVLSGILFPPEQYDTVRTLWNNVIAGDQDPLILKTNPVAGK